MDPVAVREGSEPALIAHQSATVSADAQAVIPKVCEEQRFASRGAITGFGIKLTSAEMAGIGSELLPAGRRPVN